MAGPEDFHYRTLAPFLVAWLQVSVYDPVAGSADALVFRHPGPGKDVIVNFKHIEVLVDHLHADLGTRHQDFFDQFYALKLVLSLSELPCDLFERLERVQGKRVQYPGPRRNDLGQLLAKAVIVRGDD